MAKICRGRERRGEGEEREGGREGREPLGRKREKGKGRREREGREREREKRERRKREREGEEREKEKRERAAMVWAVREGSCREGRERRGEGEERKGAAMVSSLTTPATTIDGDLLLLYNPLTTPSPARPKPWQQIQPLLHLSKPGHFYRWRQWSSATISFSLLSRHSLFSPSLSSFPVAPSPFGPPFSLFSLSQSLSSFANFCHQSVMLASVYTSTFTDEIRILLTIGKKMKV